MGSGEPVLVRCDRGEKRVLVRPVFRGPGGFAPADSVGWEHAGDVWDTTGYREGKLRTTWKAVSVGGASVTGDTKAIAIALMLDERGEYEVSHDETIPPLFEMEGA